MAGADFAAVAFPHGCGKAGVPDAEMYPAPRQSERKL
jgi:hypothetical protein